MSRKAKASIFFARGVPPELHQRLAAEAKRQGKTIGRLLTEILQVALPRSQGRPSLEDRVVRLECAVAELQGEAPRKSKRRH